MNELADEWLVINRIVLYGWGNVGKKCFPKLNNDFDIVSIIDNDSSKQGEFCGVPIVNVNDARDILESNKIVVLTGGKVYKDIANSLIELDLREYIDFCSIEIFISEWYWSKKGQNCLLEVHTAVTMQCTFKCRNCNMFVPYYREKVDYLGAELKQMYDMFFKYVDYVFCVTLLGGEPFLSQATGEIINYLGEKYSAQIGVINIISNGSMMPDDETLEIMRKNNVLVYLSDYSSAIPYKEKLMQVVEKLEDNNIQYALRSSEHWKDFGFPTVVPNIGKDVAKHMNTCAPLFHGLNDNKFYYCHVAWSAEKAGMYRLEKNDYIDLENLAMKDRRNIVYHALGSMEPHYVSLCKICGGCGVDNPNNVKAAIQVETNHE